MKKLLVLVTLGFILAGCHFGESSGGSGNGTVETTGVGVADQSIMNVTQRRATSRNAAIVSAKSAMLTRIRAGRTRVDGNTQTIGNLIDSDATVASAVNSLISGSEIISTEWAVNDDATVVIRLALSSIRNAIGVPVLSI